MYLRQHEVAILRRTRPDLLEFVKTERTARQLEAVAAWRRLFAFALEKAAQFEAAIADHVEGCGDCAEFLETLAIVDRLTAADRDHVAADCAALLEENPAEVDRLGGEVEGRSAEEGAVCGRCGAVLTCSAVWTVADRPMCNGCMRAVMPPLLWPLVSAVERVLEPSAYRLSRAPADPDGVYRLARYRRAARVLEQDERARIKAAAEKKMMRKRDRG